MAPRKRAERGVDGQRAFGTLVGPATRVDVARTVGECFAAMGPLQCIAAVAAVSPRAIDRPSAAVVFTAAGDGAFSAVTLRTPEAIA
jgi:hypothetical protein